MKVESFEKQEGILLLWRSRRRFWGPCRLGSCGDLGEEWEGFGDPSEGGESTVEEITDNLKDRYRYPEF